MCQAQIKIKVISLLEELQSSVRPCPRIRAGGWPPTEEWPVQSVCKLLGFRRCSDIITLTFSQSRLHWHAIVLSIVARHRAQSVADSSWRKNGKKDATDSRKKILCYWLLPGANGFTAINGTTRWQDLAHLAGSTSRIAPLLLRFSRKIRPFWPGPAWQSTVGPSPRLSRS
jgi:hypothetical protein